MKVQQIETMTQNLASCIRAFQKISIMHGANPSHAQPMTYPELNKSRDMLTQNSNRYMVNEKGHRYLDALVQLDNVFEDRACKTSVEKLGES